ncbi:hypothetical protein J2R99_000270 [Rhodopseudomonas julia]|uniref:CENP-V/GFA domain-containing protein n=1 Tax=Rhodopseudomonas julia TaxID=200617 RepID=A0ABU0C1N3_9BRAD|nr:GFA family protein [Rhodopseudomonas julia]MDQ0324421.1 hypothetical protein [Rhodopseudomonas julia]
MDEAIEGGCLCGRTRYRATRPPSATTNCHCRSCRMAAGASGVAWAVFSREDFTFSAGERVIYHSSPGVQRGFCGRCGTSLTYESDHDPDVIEVNLVTLDHADDFPPERESWLDDALPWEVVDPDLPHHRGSRKEPPDA